MRRLDASAVDADLAGTEQPIDMAPRHPLELAEQPVVDALAGGVVIDHGEARASVA
jgi:hypothetical protein